MWLLLGVGIFVLMPEVQLPLSLRLHGGIGNVSSCPKFATGTGLGPLAQLFANDAAALFG